MKVNDLVTRISHHHDIVFRIVAIETDKVVLKGEVVRLLADAPIQDVVIVNEKEKALTLPPLSFIHELRGKTISGLVLHIDGDEQYLKKAMLAYKEYKVSAIGYYITEKEMPQKIAFLLKKHHPDVLVITGHDALDGKDRNDIQAYRTSSYFVDAVIQARNYQSNKDALVIIAGACQSYYEALLKAGANFASSPTRENIHLLDPVIIAAEVSHTIVSHYVPVQDVLSRTISHRLGGIDTKGVARRTFLGGS